MGVTVHLYWITPDGNYYEAAALTAAGLLSEERKLAVRAAMLESE